ncbi:MAG: ABC transporter permease subunit, partial [Stackebrandtia sp.]
ALRTVFSQITPVVFLGLGVVITMAVGEFDLSFAGIFSISAVAVPALAVLHGWPVPLAVVAALVIALAVGALNAALVVGVGSAQPHNNLGVGVVGHVAGNVEPPATRCGLGYADDASNSRPHGTEYPLLVHERLVVANGAPHPTNRGEKPHNNGDHGSGEPQPQARKYGEPYRRTYGA